jgi:3-dehydroquinate synthase
MAMKRILVRSSAGMYPVVCGSSGGGALARQIASLGKFTSVQILTSPRVWGFLGKRLLRELRTDAGVRIHLFADGEGAKTLKSVERLARSLARAHADRRVLLIAVGGGVVGDVAGFVAATYLRGVSLIHIPTTLVAQTDSAIGGKTGVNIPEGKNLVGAFYPPRLVFVDPAFLDTLPKREFRSGMAEVIKYGVIADGKLFGFLEENLEKALGRDVKVLRHLITRCVEIKAAVVSKDEKESGLREILNFGHTFGHALESATHYRRYQHGEAVARGMMAAALLGHEIGVTPARDASRIVALVRRLGALPPWPRVTPGKLLDFMLTDKKARGGKLRFVLSPALGKASSYDNVPLALVKRVLHFAPQLGEGQAVFHD